MKTKTTLYRLDSGLCAVRVQRGAYKIDSTWEHRTRAQIDATAEELKRALLEKTDKDKHTRAQDRLDKKRQENFDF